MYYTYILYSASFNIYYKGTTENPDQRRLGRNSGKNTFSTGIVRVTVTEKAAPVIR
jgi:predicted GIY-YIG superfamily endonuclease